MQEVDENASVGPFLGQQLSISSCFIDCLFSKLFSLSRGDIFLKFK